MIKFVTWQLEAKALKVTKYYAFRILTLQI